MYLIKAINFTSSLEEPVAVEDGLRLIKFGGKLSSCDEYWGETHIHITPYADCSLLKPTVIKTELCLTYATHYYPQALKDGFKRLFFNVSLYEPEKLEGYLVFVSHQLKEIRTNGKKIFEKYPSGIIVELKDGEYFEFDGRRVEVINKQFNLLA